MYLPACGLGEFRCGIAASRYRRTYEAWLDDHLGDFNVLAITAETTGPYASLRTILKQIGRPIPANDAWIAALAIRHGLPLLSRDEHFDGLPGVRRIGWSPPEKDSR